MTPFPWTDVLIIAGLIVLNGLFAMSELAIVSAKPARLKAAADKGSKAAAAALALQGDPGKFLSTVQAGITIVAIVSGAYSGSSLGGPAAERLAALGVPAEYAEEAGFALVIASARRRPVLTCGSTDKALANIMSTSPDIRSVIAGAVPR